MIALSMRLIGAKGFLWFTVALFAAVGIAVVELLISIVIQMLLLSLGFTQSAPKFITLYFPSLSVVQVTCFLCIVALVRFIVQLSTTHISSFLKDLVHTRLRKNAIYLMLFSEIIEDRTPSIVNFRISEVFPKSSEFVYNGCLSIFMFLQCLALFFILIFVSWKESSIAFLGILGIGLVVIAINKRVSLNAKLIPISQKKLNEGIEKSLRNFIFIKLMKKQKSELLELEKFILDYSSKQVTANFLSNFSAQIGPFLGILLLVCIILISHEFWETSPIVLLSFIYLLARFVQSLSILMSYLGNSVIYFPQYQMSLASINHRDAKSFFSSGEEDVTLFGKIKKRSDQHPQKSTGQQNFLAPSRAPHIKIHNVRFEYPGQSQPILNGLDLEITAGSQLGIRGSSGTGKSTLLMIILGILKPTKGKILMDGSKADAYFLREEVRIGYVGAEPFIIRGSIRDNLMYGLSCYLSDGDLLEALKKVAMSDFVSQVGLDYQIYEDHSGLSAGQKQRLCLARALLNQPCLLILDEATANLDETNEQLIAQVIRDLKGQCTTLIVSHRPGILAFIDNLYYLDHTKI